MSLRKFPFFFLLVLLSACGHDAMDVDVSQTKVSIDFEDIHTLLWEADSVKLISETHRLKDEMRDLYELQTGYFLQFGNPSDSTLWKIIQDFRKDEYIEKLESEIDNQYSDLGEIESNLITAFKYYKTFFPQKTVPKKVAYLNTLFASSAPATENEIGIGLERYLGDSAEVIKQLNGTQHYDWMRKAWQQDYLERDVIASWIYTNGYPEPNGGTVAEKMIYWGKVLYFTEACLQEEPRNVILRQTAEDYQWMEDNISDFWNYIVKEKLLFSNNEKTKMNLLKEGPFTAGLPMKAPDRFGQFLGWKMVHQYMSENDISLEKLETTDYNKILQSFELD